MQLDTVQPQAPVVNNNGHVVSVSKNCKPPGKLHSLHNRGRRPHVPEQLGKHYGLHGIGLCTATGKRRPWRTASAETPNCVKHCQDHDTRSTTTGMEKTLSKNCTCEPPHCPLVQAGHDDGHLGPETPRGAPREGQRQNQQTKPPGPYQPWCRASRAWRQGKKHSTRCIVTSKTSLAIPM